MFRLGLATIVTLTAAGCATGRIDLPQDPLRMTMIQRTERSIPGSSNGARIRLEDITEGQVLISIRRPIGRRILDLTSVRQGDIVPFQLGRHAYWLKVVELRNLLVGDDFAVIEISSREPDGA